MGITGSKQTCPTILGKSMKIVVGLGNPKEEYASTRHNVGFMLVNKLQDKNLPTLKLFKSDVFMNDSGEFVKKIFNSKDFDNLIIIHDDLDIPLGSYKIQKGKGPRLHNGVLSVEKELGRDDFWRVRVGVDSRSPEARIPGEKYVLQNFTPEELTILDKTLDRIGHESIFQSK